MRERVTFYKQNSHPSTDLKNFFCRIPPYLLVIC